MSIERTVRRLPVASMLALLVTLAATSCGGGTHGTIRIGFYGDCHGFFTSGHEAGTAGVELPFIRRGAMPKGSEPTDGVGSITIAGKRVELVVDCDYYGSSVSELAAIRRLVEQQHADIVVTPGFVPDFGEVFYPRHQPGVTFISTGLLPVPAQPNVFRVSMSAREASAGLGAYAYHTLGWRTAATFGEDDPLGWSITSGFVAEFCSLGGKVIQRSWAPAEFADWGRRVRQLPRGVDGVALMTGLQSTTNFFPAYRKLRPDLSRHVVASAFAIAEGFFRQPGVMTAGFLPFVSTAPSWRAYFRDLHAAFPQYKGVIGTPADVYGYDAVELALEAIARVHGDMSHGERGFKAALPALLPRVRTPTGTTLRLDRNQHVVRAELPHPVREGRRTAPSSRLTVGLVPKVDDSFGGYFTRSSPPDSETQPVCRKGHVPPWAR